MAEALAMQTGLSLAVHVGGSKVKAESDSTKVIEACKSDCLHGLLVWLM